jgi:pimeloyl-ACP methyl ester carboxylesterase
MYGLMDALGIDEFKAIGHSSGGMTLTHMSLMAPSRITSMILIGSTSIFPEACREIQRNTTYETADPGMLGFLTTIHSGGEQQIRSIFAQFRAMAETFDDMDFSPEDLSGIKAETFIVHGDRDMFFPVDIPVLSFKAIPNSYLWIVPNDGHVPVGLSGGESVWTDSFFAVAKDFLAGKWNNK